MEGTVIASSDAAVPVEGNHYFPPGDVRWEYLEPSPRTTRCWWKGTARYWSVHVDGAVNADAAWAYPSPSLAAQRIRDHVAFWRGVVVHEEQAPSRRRHCPPPAAGARHITTVHPPERRVLRFARGDRFLTRRYRAADRVTEQWRDHGGSASSAVR